MFSCHSESSQNTFPERDRSNELGKQIQGECSFRFFFFSKKKIADPANVGKSLLDGNKDHLLNQARSELMKQEHQVGSLNSCIDGLQPQAYAQEWNWRTPITDILNLEENNYACKKTYL